MSNTYKILIVDDEYPARQELRYLLKDYPNLEIVGEATNAGEAMQLINALDYSILFLDIQMPGVDGLELCRQLKESGKSPLVVFVTAHQEYAIDAFDVNAVDYLLKPVSEKKLQETVQKIISRLEATKSGEKTSDSGNKAETSPTLEVVPVDYQGKTILLKEQDIIFINASNDYTEIKTYNKKYLSRFTLKELEKRLNPNLFYRCHRSYMVNIKKVREVVPLYNGTLLLTVDDMEKTEVPVSRSQAKKVKKILGIDS
ncbi:MAG: two component transcriptional regulator, LytTR family [Clostridiales bacterium]|jgi:two-component system LytT family response regulator/two-component system response regulator LytT|nr:two component transcriptional regulator, LytTR family [Clostridiales bacterium]